MEARLLEQAAAPADAGQESGSPGVTETQFAASGSPRRAAARAIASVAWPDAGCDDRRRADPLGRRADDRGPGVGSERVERVVLGNVDDRSGMSAAASAPPGPISSAWVSPPRPARERQRLQRYLGRGTVGVLDENEVHDATTDLLEEIDDGGRRVGAVTEHSRPACLALRDDQPRPLEARRRACGRRRLERLAPGAHPRPAPTGSAVG